MTAEVKQFEPSIDADTRNAFRQQAEIEERILRALALPVDGSIASLRIDFVRGQFPQVTVVRDIYDVNAKVLAEVVEQCDLRIKARKVEKPA